MITNCERRWEAAAGMGPGRTVEIIAGILMRPRVLARHHRGVVVVEPRPGDVTRGKDIRHAFDLH